MQNITQFNLKIEREKLEKLKVFAKKQKYPTSVTQVILSLITELLEAEYAN
jgi:hypothetical protein